jgi:lysocardiolipin and lysophospholipid acyltransferase
MYWRRFSISTIPLENAEVFHEWIQQRWNEKDDLLEAYNNTGLFPPNADSVILENSTKPVQQRYIDTSVQLVNWWEVAGIFTPLLTVVLVSNILKQLWRLFSNTR